MNETIEQLEACFIAKAQQRGQRLVQDEMIRNYIREVIRLYNIKKGGEHTINEEKQQKE